MTPSPLKPGSALYLAVKEHIRARIQDGTWKVGDRIPSEHELVGTLKVSRMTVHRALRELAEQGALTRVAGVGTFVAEPKAQSGLTQVANLADEVRVQVQDAYSRRGFPRREMVGEAEEGAPGDLVATAQPQGQQAEVQHLRDAPGVGDLGAIQILPFQAHRPRIEKLTAATHGQIGESPTQGFRRQRGPRPPLIAPHPLITSKAHDGRALRGHRGEGTDHLVPAQGQRAFCRVDPAFPGFQARVQADLGHQGSMGILRPLALAVAWARG